MRRLSINFAVFLTTILLRAPVQAIGAPTFYTADQAKQGRDIFARSCSACHIADRAGSAGGSKIPLAGTEFIREWYSVADLFSKISWTMPSDHVLGLSTDANVNVIAYLLQANGFRAGKDPLRSDRNAMLKMVLNDESTAKASALKPAGASPDGYFTAEQANRGKAFFRGSCSLCHTTEPPGPNQDPNRIPPPAGRGMWMGSQRFFMSLAGEQFMEHWRNVGDLYNKIRTTMPGYDAAGLSTEAYVEIVAYLLQVNGLPSGREGLGKDVSTMKTMTLVEKGFQRLFNGKDFTGLKFVLGHSCAPAPSGCGRTDPGTTFRVENGTIFCSGKPYGYMYTEKKYFNFTLRLEYRFLPYEGMETDDDFYGNSGYLLFITKNQVWPKMLEVQGRNTAVLSLHAEDSWAKYTVDDQARKRAIHPVGQWNAVEIVSKDGQVRSYLNGTLISIVSEHEFKEPGYLGFQSEGGQIYWRNIRIREE